MRQQHLAHVILLAVTVFFLASLVATAGGTVTVPAVTQLQRGQTGSIAILGRIETQGTAQLIFHYPSKIISINGARGASDFGITCPIVPIASQDVVNAVTGKIVFECTSNASTTNDTLLILDVTALDEQFTYGWLTPIGMLVDNSLVVEATLTGGLIELPVAGHPTNATSEGITGNFPNPFALTTQFVYQMSEAGDASFTLLSTQGRNVKELPTVQAVAGENVLDFAVHANEIAQGVYILRMITDRNVYYHSFMVLH